MAQVKRDIRFRVYIAFLGICLFGIAILWRGMAIQLLHGKELIASADSSHTRLKTLTPERGNIYSEDGSLLSSSIPEFDIHVDFNAIQKDTFKNNVEKLSEQLASLFKDKSAKQYEDILNQEFKNKSTYFLLKNNAKYNQYLALRTFAIFKLGKNKGGFITDAQIKRVNPFGMLGNRIIGIWRAENKIGLEGTYNEVLSGEEGERVERKIAGGTWMPMDGSEIDPQNGKDIVTTIDVNTQDIAENALLKVLIKEEAAFGTCIVMETKTGKIKAMANLGRQTDGSYWEDYNYAIRTIEPGSTFKLNALMSAIDDGYVTIDSKVNASGGSAYFGKQKMSDSHLGLGTISVKEAFAHSSNVACAKLVWNNYYNHPQDYLKHLKAMQIDQPTEIDIAGEQKPRFSHAEDPFKNISSLAWMAIGYEVMISPMRTCMAYNTIANNGVMMKPYIVSTIKEFGKVIKEYQPTIVTNNVCKPSTIAQLKEATYAVVEEGTGKALKNDVYTICGKTGTAQVADKGITYADGVYHGSFVGFFPKENPMYTICVVIRTKKGANNYYGGQIALPIFKEVADRLYANNIKEHAPIQALTKTLTTNFSTKNTNATQLNILNKDLHIYKNIPNSNAWLSNITVDSTGATQYGGIEINNNQVPDVSGMGLRNALQLLENMGLKVTVSGKGKVVNQSLPAGSALIKGQYINIQLG